MARRLLAVGLGVAALSTGCGGDTDPYTQVDSSELSPRLQEAQQKLTDAGYEAIGADMRGAETEAARVVLVNPESDDALMVAEGGLGDVPLVPANVVNVEVEILCGHLIIGGPDRPPHDHPVGEARTRSGICRR